ncbi:MAG: PilN domain-containing protein [bacterium]|nr:PilN domain-containing protein [bacterium]
MKIILDLLPEIKKEKIRKDKIFIRVIRQEIIFSLPIFFFIVILLAINFTQKIIAQGAENNFGMINSQQEYKDLKKYEDKFSEIGAKTSEILKIQKNHLNWLGVFSKLENAIPDNVYISNLATDNYQVSLAGKAKTREDFLKFQENIKSEDCFSNVNIPLSSLVSKENVEFQVDFEIKEDCLKNKL